MKMPLIALLFFIINSFLVAYGCDEKEPERGTVQFFEKIYKTKIEGLKPIQEFSDPDQFYTAIARQVGIPQLAFKAVEEKFGWKQSEEFYLSAMVKGSSIEDDWGVMVVRFSKKVAEQIRKDKAGGKPIPKEIAKNAMEMKFVVIDYDGNISFPQEKKNSPKEEKPQAEEPK
ncbi:MAG: hypothetical protein ACJ0K4_11220 [Verrucomicrobiales bacterium]|nr:MAG: hypothetical protein EVB09_01720 [Verrucomicrobiaceae bacterium]